MCCFFFFQAEDGIRDLVRSRGLGDVYKRQDLHQAVDGAIDRLTKELGDREEQTTRGVRESMVAAAQARTALTPMLERAEHAGDGDTDELCQAISVFVGEPLPAEMRAEGDMEAVTMLRVYPGDVLAATEDLVWEPMQPELHKRMCTVCRRVYCDDDSEALGCRFHSGRWSGSAAIMPGWNCCFVQVKTDPGCVKAAHQPCPKYDVQMDAERAAVRQAVRLERVSGEREKQEAIELEEEESIFSKIMLF
eukprot:TRINITY_DN4825_c0_g1_i2.p1 TRINITY_DN4825_c0_g1~~TRINITY_DN4825_c0_g1_i2.p1  ORF type:complete len:249 (+),score=50.52 TRINITY_DN4825_c0_g1_i2:21-767(+)